MANLEFSLPENFGEHDPKIGLVLGSGLGDFVDALTDTQQIA